MGQQQSDCFIKLTYTTFKTWVLQSNTISGIPWANFSPSLTSPSPSVHEHSQFLHLWHQSTGVQAENLGSFMEKEKKKRRRKMFIKHTAITLKVNASTRVFYTLLSSYHITEQSILVSFLKDYWNLHYKSDMWRIFYCCLCWLASALTFCGPCLSSN